MSDGEIQTAHMTGVQLQDQEEEARINKQVKSEEKLPFNSVNRGVLLIVFICLVVGWIGSTFRKQSPSQVSTIPDKSTQIPPVPKILKQRLPQILWIYTQNEKEAEPMESDIFVNYYEEAAKSAGFEVRFANSWNSYDWINNSTTEKITKTMQNSLIDQSVHSLLKLALLIDNGGVLFDWGNIFLTDSFDFLGGMFDIYEDSPAMEVSCPKERAFLYMPQKDHVLGRTLSSSVVAAVPNGTLLKQAFGVLTEIMVSGKLPFEGLQPMKWNEDTGIHFLEKSFELAVNIAAFKGR